MMIILVITYSLMSILSYCDLENGWRGIRVFESSRSDVERAFGKRAAGDLVEARYETTDAAIRVLYSKGPCRDDTLTGSFRTKAETVLQYEVIPKNTLQLKDLKIRLEQYSRFEDTHVVGVVEYYNKQHAIQITTWLSGSDEKVRTIRFFRTEKQRLAFRCD